ncbi:hypothetical protein D3C84_897670 [compost metagenome]
MIFLPQVLTQRHKLRTFTNREAVRNMHFLVAQQLLRAIAHHRDGAVPRISLRGYQIDLLLGEVLNLIDEYTLVIGRFAQTGSYFCRHAGGQIVGQTQQQVDVRVAQPLRLQTPQHLQCNGLVG